MSELDLQRLLRDFAAGVPVPELCTKYEKAPSTIHNLKTKYRDEIAEISRKWAVQFEDLHMTRKQSRLDDIQELRNLGWEQLRALLASSCVIDGRTGEVRAGPVDERKFKVFFELILKANRNFAEETGQLPQRVEGLDERFTLPVLGLGSGNGIDYAAAAQRRRDREATAPEREAAEREHEAERHTQMRQLLASVGLEEQSSEHRVQNRERQSFEEWLADEEQRLAQEHGPSDGWPDDPESVESLRADLDRLYPGDESMRARLERLIESATRDRDTGSSNAEVVDEEQPLEVGNVEVWRAIPGRSSVEEPEPELESEPAEESAEEPEPEPDVPSVDFEVEQAARAIASKVWGQGSMPRALLYQGMQPPVVDQYLAYAESQGWVAVGGDLVVKGGVNPQPAAVTRIPNF
jgi:hypothetical protein